MLEGSGDHSSIPKDKKQASHSKRHSTASMHPVLLNEANGVNLPISNSIASTGFKHGKSAGIKRENTRPVVETRLKHVHTAGSITERPRNPSHSSGSTESSHSPKNLHFKPNSTPAAKLPPKMFLAPQQIGHRRSSIDAGTVGNARRNSLDPSQFKTYAELENAMKMISLKNQPHHITIPRQRKPTVHSRSNSTMPVILQDDESDEEPLAEVLTRKSKVKQQDINYFTVPFIAKQSSYPLKATDINFTPVDDSTIARGDGGSEATIVEDDDNVPLALLPKLKR